GLWLVQPPDLRFGPALLPAVRPAGGRTARRGCHAGRSRSTVGISATTPGRQPNANPYRPDFRSDVAGGHSAQRATGGPEDMSATPAINGLVEIIVGDARLYRSRMEDIGDGVLAVAAPMGTGDLDVPPSGTDLELAWIHESNRYVMPVRLAGLARGNTLQW